MDTNDMSIDEEILMTIPVKISFDAIENFLAKKFVGEIISKEDPKGKEIKYAKILDIKISQSTHDIYNIAITVKLQTLTFLFRERELLISILMELTFDVDNQKLFIESYKMDSKGKSWITDQMLKSILNTFIYQKIIEKLSFDLKPIVKENLNLINTKLASNLELKEGISLIGSLDNLTVSHIEIKNSQLWVFIRINGWGIIDIQNLEFQ
ncbi:DUF4403 family protein [Winogradskyella bathintestinalis]|uniref:DUF4403 family protein n=1 Tax=Winogradskyella bathintestinalis TaxID=3035208 RepID=A0ABT7ZUW7_9FLAO|nr:DUF4403 family protein [Winogradskyella bathintestinalis]MDN3492829.1 DUF4403 family protein [Winogradskyella bathintestinalis]